MPDSPPEPHPPPVVVRRATGGDLADTAEWHCHDLPHGLFPCLGTAFVRRWHGTFLDGEHGVALVAELATPEGPRPVGFLVGATDQRRHLAGVVRRHRLRLGVHGALALLRRPRCLLVFLRTRAGAYARRLLPRPGTRSVGTGAPPAAVAVVTAVVVDPSARGTGAGSALVGRFVAEARGAGASRADLATLAGPDGAGRFYERLGWQPVRERTNRDGARSVTYRLDLTEPPPTSAPAASPSVARSGAA